MDSLSFFCRYIIIDTVSGFLHNVSFQTPFGGRTIHISSNRSFYNTPICVGKEFIHLTVWVVCSFCLYPEWKESRCDQIFPSSDGGKPCAYFITAFYDQESRLSPMAHVTCVVCIMGVLGSISELLKPPKLINKVWVLHFLTCYLLSRPLRYTLVLEDRDKRDKLQAEIQRFAFDRMWFRGVCVG